MGLKLKQLLENEKGMALAVVLMVVVVFSLLGIGLISVAATNIKLATVDRSNQSAYYIAEAGANYKLAEMRKAVDDAYTTANNVSATQRESYFFSRVGANVSGHTSSTYTTFPQEYHSNPKAVVTMTGSGSDYTITSTGTVDGQTAVVKQNLSVNYVQPSDTFDIPQYAVFGTTDSNSTMHLDGSAKINGPVGTNATITPSIYMTGSASITEEVDVNQNVDPSSVINKPAYLATPTVGHLSHTYSFPDPITNFPSIPNSVPYPNQTIRLKDKKEETFHPSILLF